MSRNIEIKATIKNLDILRDSCNELGYEFMKGQLRFRSYYSHGNNCLHAIKIPGAKYELGVIKDKDVVDEEAFSLTGDFDMSYGGLNDTVGHNAWKLVAKYEEEQTKYAAILNNHTYQTMEMEDRTRIEIFVD